MPLYQTPPACPIDHLALVGQDDAPALMLRGGTLSYQDLRYRVAALAGWLAGQSWNGQGMAPGARVASWVAKGEIACLMPLAAARAGLVHVPINPLLKRAQVAHILADSGAELLIATPARGATLEFADLADARLVAEDVALAEAQSADPLPPSGADPQTLAAILYTSGSTGRPKGVMLSHANMWLGAESVTGYLDLGPQDRVLAVLPLAFDYGQNQLFSAWAAGASVAPLDYLTARDVVKAVARHQITTLAAVPPLWVQLAEADWPMEAAGHLTRLTNSGGALTEPLVRSLRGVFPQARLFAMYGLTEAFRSTFLPPELIDAHPTSVGGAIPHAEVLLVRDDGALCEDGEEGEIVHCGPLVAQGYWQDAARTAERFRAAPAGSHYGGMAVWSGDRGWREDGRLYFAGRRDAMIKSAGNRISPQEIEEAALATGLVAEAVALGVADARVGQVVHLVVRARRGVDEAAAEALPRLLQAELPGFMCPRGIHWRGAMSLGPNGKIDREALLAELIEQVRT